MISLSVAATFFVTALFLAYAPGPDIIFVTTQSAVHGVRSGLSTMMGLLTGLLVHTVLVSAGVAAVILASPVCFTILKCAGAAYLLRLAWLAWKAGAMSASGQVPDFPGYAALYRRGIVMNITNPKVSLFFLAFLPQFCDPARGSVALQCVQLGLIFMLATAVGFGSAAFLSGKLFSKLATSARGQVALNRISSVIFAGLALTLLISKA